MAIFSVIIPVYKVEKYITQCIESVLNQTFTDFEVFCVDDCGGDNSIKIVEEYAQKDKRINVLYHDKNRGLSASRNTALKVATGKYTLFLDSDDWWELDCLEIIYNAFQKFKTNTIWFDANKYIENTQTLCDKSILQNRAGYLTLTPENICNLSDYCWVKAYLTSSIKDYNLTFPEGLTYEDGEFYFKYFTFNPDTYIIENRLYNYRVRKNSITQTTSIGDDKIENIFKILKNLRQFYIANNLYEEYKPALLRMINVRINLCIDCGYSKTSFLLAKQFLKEYKFFEDYRIFDTCMKPLVSIILPICNVDSNTIGCLKSIQCQIYSNLEIICINKCIPPKSIKTIEQMAKDDSRIKVVNNDVDIKDTNGEYILFGGTDNCLNAFCVENIVKDFKATGSNIIQKDSIKAFRQEFLIKNPETHAVTMF